MNKKFIPSIIAGVSLGCLLGILLLGLFSIIAGNSGWNYEVLGVVGGVVGVLLGSFIGVWVIKKIKKELMYSLIMLLILVISALGLGYYFFQLTEESVIILWALGYGIGASLIPTIILSFIFNWKKSK